MIFLQIWRKLGWQLKLILLISLLFVLVVSYQACSNYFAENGLREELQRKNEQQATETRIAVNKAEEKANNSANETKEIIKTDSNKYSTDSNALTNKFCEYMCKEGVLDSSCVEWAKQNKRRCN